MMTNALIRIASLASLLTLVACSGGNDGTKQSHSQIAGNGACADEDEDEGAADKVTCSADSDCDSDEFCSEGLCSGTDGEVEDDEECVDEDEGAADKVFCSTNADCDSDEVCANGKCE